MSMQAIHVSEPGSASVLKLTTVPIPKLESEHDILVRVRGVALNPVDTMYRDKAGKIMGYDGAGEVIAVGAKAQTRFKEGDRVLYAGSITRTGSNAQYQLVDARIVGHLPEGVKDWAQAAALPLVSLTAWEMFEDHFNLRPDANDAKNANETLLIVNGAGGVGTSAIQLARKAFGIKTIIATASRPETIEWVKKVGATHVIDHRKELGPQLKDLGLQPSLALDCRDAATYVPALVPLMRPFGRIGTIANSSYALSPELTQIAFLRSLSVHYEFMFARSMWGHDMSRQGEILDRVAELAAHGGLDAGVTRRERLSAKTLKEGHEFQESQKAYGKIAFDVANTLDEE